MTGWSLQEDDSDLEVLAVHVAPARKSHNSCVKQEMDAECRRPVKQERGPPQSPPPALLVPIDSSVRRPWQFLQHMFLDWAALQERNDVTEALKLSNLILCMWNYLDVI